METLDYLINKGLLEVDYRPVKPKPDRPIKVVQNGVIFQQQCHNGLPYDIAISWLQKAIRRGLKDQALYCAYHIASLGKIFRSHLCNRLITILSEDIGPAEPGLAVIIEELYDRAKKAKDRSETHTYIIQMVSLLSDSRKSRITDCLATADHPPGEPKCVMLDGLEQLVQWAIYMCKEPGRQSTDNVPVRYTYRGKKCYTERKLSLYHIWNMMLDVTEEPSIYNDIVALMRLFSIRGPEYGLIHFIHAVTLVYLGNKTTLPGPATGLPDLPDWDDLKNLDFPVMNDAVDMHTRYGRLLGRGQADFLYHGSRLENWTPFPGEKEIIQRLKDHVQHPEIEDSEPREYQAQIIKDTVNHLGQYRSGWLLMACGTGKTKTSYWIMNNIIKENGGKGLVVIVVPYLQILRQFHGCWSAMNRLHKLKSITGILASCADSYNKDDYSNYEYLDTTRSLGEFMKYPDNVKFIFTTYSSLPKLLRSGIEPTFTVYDEAHHAKTHKIFKAGKELFMTATPPPSSAVGGVIANYNLRDAINDGVLTPYKIGVIEDSDDVQGLAFAQHKARKTIVYCNTNINSRNFYNDWLIYCTESSSSAHASAQSFYIDCKTGKRERQRIFNDYRRAKRAVIFNCAILGEGVDFTDCDSIFIQSGYISATRVVQAIGRPLRLMKGKKLAHIFIMDDGKIDKRINAMEIYDPNVRDHIEYIY
jgi:superfamily II DNA or RNA helicase